MTKYNTLDIKLSNPQVKILKSGIKVWYFLVFGLTLRYIGLQLER